MTKKVKRAISLFLAALMLLSTMAVVAFADNKYTEATSKEIGPHDCVIGDDAIEYEYFVEGIATLKKEKEVAPTCKKTGSYDLVYLCTICGKELKRVTVTATKDASLKKAPCKAATTPTIENVKAPTCKKEGSYDEVYRCVVCNKVCYTKHVIVKVDKDAHVADKARKENIVEATCAKEGSYDSVIRCKICDKVLSSTYKVVPKLTYHMSALDSTAFKDEKGAYTRTCADGEDRCLVCGTLLQPAIPHLYDKGTIVPAANKDGFSVVVYTCIICGATKQEIGKKAFSIKQGDVDNSNTVTSADARYILRAAVGLAEFDKVIDSAADSVSFKTADMDNNGKIEAADARLALRTAIGLEKIVILGVKEDGTFYTLIAEAK